MTWILIPDGIPTSHYFVLVLSNVFSASVSWGIARWYYKKEVIYSNLTPWNMAFVSILTIVAACLIGSALCNPEAPRDPWHDEEMIQNVREIRTTIRARSPTQTGRQSPERYATQEAELIAAGFTNLYRPVIPATRGNKFSSCYAVRVGRETGIFPSWDEARKHVDGFSGADHRSFRKYDDAVNWLLGRLAMPDVRR